MAAAAAEHWTDQGHPATNLPVSADAAERQAFAARRARQEACSSSRTSADAAAHCVTVEDR